MTTLQSAFLHLGYFTGALIVGILFILFVAWLDKWVKLIKGHKASSELEQELRAKTRQYNNFESRHRERVAELEAEIATLKAGQPYR